MLGTDAKGRDIGEAEEILQEFGVMVIRQERLEVVRTALKRTSLQLLFPMWTALAKATPLKFSDSMPPQQCFE